MLKFYLFALFYFAFNIILLSWLFILRKGACIDQFFCSNLKHIINKHKNVHYKKLHLFNEFLYLFYAVRFVKILLFMANPRLESKYDFFNVFFQLFTTEKDAFYAFTFVLWFLFCLAIETLLYFRTPVDTITFQKYDDLIVNNFDVFRNKSTISKHQFHMQSSVSKINSLFKLSSVDVVSQPLFHLVKLKFFSCLSFSMRVRFVRAALLIEKICMVSLISMCKNENFFTR